MSRSNIFPYLINNFTRTLNEEWFFSYIFFNLKITCSLEQYITQRVMFHIDGFFSKCEQICSFLRISLQLPENWCCVGLPENMCCVGLQDFRYLSANTAQKMKLFIADAFSRCDQILIGKLHILFSQTVLKRNIFIRVPLQMFRKLSPELKVYLRCPSQKINLRRSYWLNIRNKVSERGPKSTIMV